MAECLEWFCVLNESTDEKTNIYEKSHRGNTIVNVPSFVIVRTGQIRTKGTQKPRGSNLFKLL